MHTAGSKNHLCSPWKHEVGTSGTLSGGWGYAATPPCSLFCTHLEARKERDEAKKNCTLFSQSLGGEGRLEKQFLMAGKNGRGKSLKSTIDSIAVA